MLKRRYLDVTKTSKLTKTQNEYVISHWVEWGSSSSDDKYIFIHMYLLLLANKLLFLSEPIRSDLRLRLFLLLFKTIVSLFSRSKSEPRVRIKTFVCLLRCLVKPFNISTILSLSSEFSAAYVFEADVIQTLNGRRMIAAVNTF